MAMLFLFNLVFVVLEQAWRTIRKNEDGRNIITVREVVSFLSRRLLVSFISLAVVATNSTGGRVLLVAGQANRQPLPIFVGSVTTVSTIP
jgi:hypothetical protein